MKPKLPLNTQIAYAVGQLWLVHAHQRRLSRETFGVLIFAMLTTFGNDPGDDLGIRLNGMVGFALTFAAGLDFTRYHESKVLREPAEAGETG